jgi:DnaJ-domain-containing protein 1
MYEPDGKIDKWQVEAELVLVGGTRLLGILFVKPMQRLSDLLNDSREFLPLQTTDGPIVHIRKSTIAKATQLNQSVELDAVIDPYDVLGVRRGISDKELKSTYHRLCSQNHPDKLLSLNLAPEFANMANSRLSRVIDAYHRIMATRGNTQGNGQDAKTASDSFH